MDRKFLNKVVDQIMSETTIDYEEEKVYTPFSVPLSSYSSLLFNLPRHEGDRWVYLSNDFPIFVWHCKNVYGLNKSEIDYVWKEYKEIIKDKIENAL